MYSSLAQIFSRSRPGARSHVVYKAVLFQQPRTSKTDHPQGESYITVNEADGYLAWTQLATTSPNLKPRLPALYLAYSILHNLRVVSHILLYRTYLPTPYQVHTTRGICALTVGEVKQTGRQTSQLHHRSKKKRNTFMLSHTT